MKKLQSIQNQVISLLDKGLDHRLHFHKSSHSVVVLHEALRICHWMNVDPETTELIAIAAIGHDLGYLEQFENNETIGAEMTQSLMAKEDFSIDAIEFVKTAILETSMRISPQSWQGKILRDADTGYIGTTEFSTWEKRLQEEYQATKNKQYTSKEWLQFEIQFFEQHRFFTAFSKLYRLPLKKKHLQQLKDQLDLA